MSGEYLYKIRFTPDKQGQPTGEWMRFGGHCEVEEIVELEKPEELRDNSHPAILPLLNP